MPLSLVEKVLNTQPALLAASEEGRSPGSQEMAEEVVQGGQRRVSREGGGGSPLRAEESREEGIQGGRRMESREGGGVQGGGGGSPMRAVEGVQGGQSSPGMAEKGVQGGQRR